MRKKYAKNKHKKNYKKIITIKIIKKIPHLLKAKNNPIFLLLP